MGYIKYIYLLIFVLVVDRAGAQVQSLQRADSISKEYYQLGDWRLLLSFGRQSIDSGKDFPALRIRLGYANFITGNYGAALQNYNEVFKTDSYNQTSRYYAYLCHLYLNQRQEAGYDAAYIKADQTLSINEKAFKFVDAGLESGVKFVDDSYRGTATYTRASLSNSVLWKFQIEQSAMYFGQTVDNNIPYFKYGKPFFGKLKSMEDNQSEYYAKVGYALTGNLSILGAYHYLNTNFQKTFYNSNIGLAGVKYTGSYFSIQGDYNWGTMIGRHLTQYNANLMLYPLGNLNFYTISRVSSLYQNGAGQLILTQSAGVKIFKDTWLETSVTTGNMDNYMDLNALYIYNSIDASKLKLAETAFFQLNKHFQLQLNYSFEKKTDDTHKLSYGQNSVTTGILWKF